MRPRKKRAEGKADASKPFRAAVDATGKASRLLYSTLPYSVRAPYPVLCLSSITLVHSISDTNVTCLQIVLALNLIEQVSPSDLHRPSVIQLFINTDTAASSSMGMDLPDILLLQILAQCKSRLNSHQEVRMMYVL